jgi:hypothetical protein
MDCDGRNKMYRIFEQRLSRKPLPRGSFSTSGNFEERKEKTNQNNSLESTDSTINEPVGPPYR